MLQLPNSVFLGVFLKLVSVCIPVVHNSIIPFLNLFFLIRLYNFAKMV